MASGNSAQIPVETSGRGGHFSRRAPVAAVAWHGSNRAGTHVHLLRLEMSKFV